MNPAPLLPVSVVIPAHDAGATLRPCLEALTPKLASGEVAEIIVVDDHSADETRDLAREFPVRLLSSPRRGAGAARNMGWRSATADWIWFVDADCVVHTDALDRLQRTRQALCASAVGGSYSNENSGQLTADLIHEEMVERHRGMGKLVTFAITANLLCERETLAALGGFDESLRLGQDLDFAYRVVASGRPLAFDADSLVGHYHETRLLEYLFKQARQGFWRMFIYRRHPARMRGDTYSGPIDYVQPPLALAILVAPAAGLAMGVPWLGCASSAAAALALAACQVPRAYSLVRGCNDPRYWSYVPFGALRAAARGVGMVLGAASIASAGVRASAARRVFGARRGRQYV